MSMRFDHDRHADYAMLVLAVDRELDAREAAELNGQLENCADCQARMTALQATIHEFEAARNEALDSPIPTPENSRARLKAQLSLLAAKQNRPLWERLLHLSLPGARPGTRRGYLTSAVAAITLTAFISFSVFTPAISAKEFLVRASAAQSVHASAGRAVRIRLQGKDFDYKSAELERPMRSIFAIARLDWDDPLNPTAFARWHDNVSEKSDKVTRSKGHLTLRTTTKTDLIEEASYTVEERTWLPVVETIALRDGRNLEITAVPNASPRSVAAPNRDLPQLSGTRAVTETEATSAKEGESPGPSATTVEDSEVFARVALHKIGAEDGGQVEFHRVSADILSVKMLVESEARKQSVRSALAAIPHLQPDIRTFSELAGATSISGPRPAPDKLTAATAVPAFQQELETLFPDRDARAAFVNSALTESQRASAEAWETALLVRRYGGGDVHKLGSRAREALEDLIREHLDALASALQETALRIKPLIVLPEPGVRLDSPAKPWREALLLVTQRALSLNAELQEGLIAAASDRSAAQLRGAIVSDLQALEGRLEAPQRQTRQHFLKNEENN